MNDTQMLAALQTGYQTVDVRFPTDGYPPEGAAPTFGNKTYQYKVPAVWNVKQDDWLVVLVGPYFKTVRVVGVCPLPQVISESGKRLKWAAMKIDATFLWNVEALEMQMLQYIRAAQQRREQEALLAEMRNTIGGAVDESMRAFATLLNAQPVGNALGFANAGSGKAASVPEGASEDVVRNAAASQVAQAANTTLNFDATKVQPAAETQVQQMPEGVKPSWAQ